MNNKKGSTIVWAVTLIMLLMVIVGASLSLAYVHYNQSIKNHNQTQAELIANSAIKSLTSVIEEGKITIPTNTNPKQIASMKLVNTYSNEDNHNFGSISNVYVKRKTENGKIALAYLTANYANEKYTIYAYLVYSKDTWKCIQYDTNGNRNISVSNSDSGNTGDNTGGDSGNTGGSTGDVETGSVAERMQATLNNMFNHYYVNGNSDLSSFRSWYNERKKNNISEVNTPESWWFSNADGYHLKLAYLNMIDGAKFPKLEDSIFQKAKSKNATINSKSVLYVGFHAFGSGTEDYYILASDVNEHYADNNIYMIYMDNAWYVYNGAGNAKSSDYADLDAVKNDLKNSTKWTKLD